MKFTEIFNNVRKHWSDDIDISDGKLLPGNGALFPKISNEWRRVELEFDENDDWHGLMVWSMFGVIHSKAKALFAQNKKVVNLNEIDLQDFEKVYFEDLHVEGYEEMLSEYENDL